MLAAIGGIAVGLVGVGGSYALWTASASARTGSIQAGTAGLTAQWDAGHGDAAWSNLLPGESVRQGFALTNTGDARLAIFASTLGVSGGFEVRIAAGACPSTPLASAASATTQAPLGADAAPGTPIVVQAGQSAQACLEVRATSSATPNQSVAFTTEFEGRQVQ